MKRPICLSLIVTVAALVGNLSGSLVPDRRLPDDKDSTKTFTNSIGMKFVWIPPGSFVMGSPANEGGNPKSDAQHKVTLTKGFYMGVYTVTQEEWVAVMDNNPSKFEGAKQLPVDSVSWEDCHEFIKMLRKIDKKPYRLPTEAEWEYSCRAGTTTAYHFGDDKALLGQYAWYAENSGGKTHPVGQKKPNAWGLHDMHSNVFQWCEDWISAYPQKDVVDPHGPEIGYGRVLRGGSWGHAPHQCRSASRPWNEPGNRSSDFGFRLCFFVE